MAFNNHNGSTKSYDYVRDHSETVTVSDFFLPQDEITVDYDPGTSEEVNMPDGSTLRLHTVLVLQFPSYSTRLPPTVHRTRLGWGFSGRSAQTIRR